MLSFLLGITSAALDPGQPSRAFAGALAWIWFRRMGAMCRAHGVTVVQTVSDGAAIALHALAAPPIFTGLAIG
jgi:hypothetical protein